MFLTCRRPCWRPFPSSELRLRREPNLHPVHHAVSGQAGSAAARGHQGGVRPGRVLHGSVGPDLRGGSSFPGPEADVQGQQEHRGAQGERHLTLTKITTRLQQDYNMIKKELQQD